MNHFGQSQCHPQLTHCPVVFFCYTFVVLLLSNTKKDFCCLFVLTHRTYVNISLQLSGWLAIYHFMYGYNFQFYNFQFVCACGY